MYSILDTTVFIALVSIACACISMLPPAFIRLRKEIKKSRLRDE